MNRDDGVYNICGYVNGERIMKETVTCKNSREARDIAEIVLRKRGFNPSKVKVEVVPLR